MHNISVLVDLKVFLFLETIYTVKCKYKNLQKRANWEPKTRGLSTITREGYSKFWIMWMPEIKFAKKPRKWRKFIFHAAMSAKDWDMSWRDPKDSVHSAHAGYDGVARRSTADKKKIGTDRFNCRKMYWRLSSVIDLHLHCSMKIFLSNSLCVLPTAYWWWRQALRLNFNICIKFTR